MNEQLQAALLEIINKAVKGVDASVDFLSAEIPDVVHQLLMWYAIKGAALCLTGVLVVIVWVIAEIKIVRYLESEKVDSDVWLLGYTLMGTIVRIPMVTIIINLINLDWLQIWIAPKIWLIEYVSNLTK